MTITYTAEVATCKKFGCFIKLLARWRGSIYKLVWMDLLLFLFLYYSINLVYIHLLGEFSQRTFESVVYYCASYSSLIPLSFVLGFYVNLVMTRWWEQYMTIPWPDSVAVYVSAHVHGQDERGRVMRRTVMRYVCLCLTIVFTMISPCVKKRFPKLKHLVDAGLLLENEKIIIDTMDSAFPKYPKHWMPIIWAASIITRARKEGLIRDDYAVKTIIDELNHFRGRCGTLMYYDFISIPLVYTQVVTIAVYSFFVCSLLAHQWTEFKKDTYEGLDFYMPIFITLQFFFYMGWLKVAETLINPFGEDDDDFEVNWMIDRNLQVSYLIVDEMHHEHPELVKDQYWDEVYPNELPYESEAKREQHPEPSTAKYGVDDSLPLSTIKVLPNSDSLTMVDKSRLDSLISIRSERFKEAFQRFSQYSEEEVGKTKPVPEPSMLVNSISALESVQNITSYRPTESSEESLISKIPKLLSDEGEIEDEVGEELEDYLFEDEEAEIAETLSTYETDSDSDPFERLRVERQQQRIQRMNDFLQRYFGSTLKIATPNIVPGPENVDKNTRKKQFTSTSGSLIVVKNTPNGEMPEFQSNGNTLSEHGLSMASIDYNLRRILNNLPLTEGGAEHLSPNHSFLTSSSRVIGAITAQLTPPSADILSFVSPGIQKNTTEPKVKPSMRESTEADVAPISSTVRPELLLSSSSVASVSSHPYLEDVATSPLGSASSLTTADSSELAGREVATTVERDH